MAWVLLIAAGVLEIVWAVGLKQTHGFTRPLASTVTIVALIASFVLLGLAVRTLPIGVAYAVWTGIGTVGTAVWAFTVLGEPAGVWRVVFLGMIVGGIVGLKVVTVPGPAAPDGGGIAVEGVGSGAVPGSAEAGS
jgi:quaternary ammonium compound-resistance protein SugE